MQRLIASSLLIFAFSMAEVEPFGGESCDAAEPATPMVVRNIRVQLSFYELTRSALASVMHPPAVSTTSVYERVQALEKSGDCKLINMPILTSWSGDRASCKSHRGFIFPTEYEPPGSDLAAMSLPLSPRPHSATPTAFETKHVGETLQIEAVFTGGIGQPIKVWLQHEMVTYPRNTVWMKYKDHWGRADTSFPEFDIQRSYTSLTLPNNQTQLLNSYTPNSPEGKPDTQRKIVVFVKATEISP